MEKVARELNLFRNNGGVVRIPFLVKGSIIPPPEMDREQIEAAFKDADRDILYRKLPAAQLIREPVIDRRTLKYTGEYLYHVMPPVSGRELIETDFDKLAQELYALRVEDILDYLESLSAVLGRNLGLLADVREIFRLASAYPDAFLDAWFAALSDSLDREAARAMIDNELSVWGRPGSEFLNGWVEAPTHILPGATSALAQEVFNKEIQPSTRPLVRAMPTRQLHITAGNAPDVPVISALRAILTKSAAVIKLPFGGAVTGSLLALAAAVGGTGHSLTRNLSVVYWQGGDPDIENVLFCPHVFDRVVVWGSPESVAAVQSRSLYARTICLNPRYGISLIGREVFDNHLEEAALKASVDSLIYNQKACTASLVHYIEGTEEQADRYAGFLCKALDQWSKSAPQIVSPETMGHLKRLKRGKYASARWHLNTRDGEFVSGVVVLPDEFDILDHPMCRLVIVRPVNKLENAFRYLHPGVSTVGIYPETRRITLRDRILARGVSSVLPLGECERLYAGMPHDGHLILSHLMDWKNG